MTERARVLSTASLADVKAAITEFSDAVMTIIAGVDADIARTTSWLTQDRPAHWKREVRVREDAVNLAKMEISRKQFVAMPEPASVVEERAALARAKARLDEARRRQEATRRWASAWERDAMLYKSAARGLVEAVNRDLPAAKARLDRMVTALEAYERVAAPRGDPDSPGSGGADPGNAGDAGDDAGAAGRAAEGPGQGPAGANP